MGSVANESGEIYRFAAAGAAGGGWLLCNRNTSQVAKVGRGRGDVLLHGQSTRQVCNLRHRLLVLSRCHTDAVVCTKVHVNIACMPHDADVMYRNR